jgi:hypothetical protein
MKKKRGEKIPVIDRETRRGLERFRLLIYSRTAPERRGPQTFEFQCGEDWGNYHYGVLLALGLTKTESYDIQCDTWIDAMQEGDQRQLAIFARAAEDVRRAREDGISVKAKHVTAILTCKLELETMLSDLPPKRLVIEYARSWFRLAYKMEAVAADDGKSWDEYMKEAQLKYLPTRMEERHKIFLKALKDSDL